MKRKKKAGRPAIQLPRDALRRVSMGHSFAEYDPLLLERDVAVRTAALDTARDFGSDKCFFIGRRGTGKTAVTLLCSAHGTRVAKIHPQALAPLGYDFDISEFADFRQKAFKSLTAAFGWALQLEVVYMMLEDGILRVSRLPDWVRRELEVDDNKDFDLRFLRFVNRITSHLRKRNDNFWLREIGKPKTLAHALTQELLRRPKQYTVLVDRIDESWDGTDDNVVFLAALMHACVEVRTQLENARVLLFLRENVFERVRALDSEFARLETFVLGLNWTREKLLEAVERRLNHPFSTRLPVDGTTWKYFFEDSERAKSLIFEFCLKRPRDVLTYTEHAIEAATSRNHQVVSVEDILSARRRFSDSRLKDLWDEYQENYPRLELVLKRFSGLGWRWSIRGVDLLLKALISDEEIREHCSSWIFGHSTPELFARILYEIGFFGLLDSAGNVQYRALGPQSTRAPALSDTRELVVHPVYRNALDLQDLLVGSSDAVIEFAKEGSVADLPGAIDLSTYSTRLESIGSRLRELPGGRSHASEFETLVGEIIELCFYRALTNLEAKRRTVDGAQIRDWVASNRGSGGFWEAVRIRFKADQVVWECKNTRSLAAEDFHQMGYYLGGSIGRFGIVAFRGSLETSHVKHLKRLYDQDRKAVLLLGESDLLTFVRQARNGKVKEAHIQDRYDELLRSIS